MDVVFDVAEHISVLHFGEVLEAGPTEQIRAATKCSKSIWERLAHGDPGSSGHSHLLRGRLCPAGAVAAAQARTDTGLARAQRGGQDDLGELDRRLQSPRRGKIIFKGVDITRIASFETVRSGMGLVPQGRRVFPTLSVEENLTVAERSPDRHGWNLERVYALFPRLRERRGQRARTLSGGEQQMLAIGRGLMTNPDCLIMDEPSEGLAPIIIQGVWEAIGRLKEEGLSILLVEQNASLALKLVDYVHVMSKGRVVYSARPEELRANDEIKSSYLGI